MTQSKDMEPLEGLFKVFWTNQFRTKIELPSAHDFPSLSGKIAIITGANTGLGFESARQLLSLGLSHLIVAVRSKEKGVTAASLLQKVSPTAKIDVWTLDMEDYGSITTFATRCDQELSHIDYIILNAGISPIAFTQTKSTQHETAIQVNHISTALLTVLLLPILERKCQEDRPARITVVNSLTAHLCKFPNRSLRPLLASFDDTTLTPWNPQERYGVSKLLNQLFLVRLSEMVNSNKIVINMVDPGLTKGTNLSRDASGILRIAVKLFHAICARPLDQAAATYVYALLRHGEESHGCFLMSDKITPLAGIYYTSEGKAISEQIWEETMKGLAIAEVPENLLKVKQHN